MSHPQKMPLWPKDDFELEQMRISRFRKKPSQSVPTCLKAEASEN